MKSYAEFCARYGYEDDEVTQKLYREYKANFRLFEEFMIAQKENEEWKKKMAG